MDLKGYLILLIIIILGVYLGSMWTHKMIKADEEKETYRRWLLEQHNAGNNPPIVV